jgi:hypothetical protein
MPLSAHENGAAMDAAVKLHGRHIPAAPSHHSRSHMYCRLRLVVLRSARTLTQALGHRSAPSPWLTGQAPGPLLFHRLQPPSTRTDRAITFLIPRRTSGAPRLTGFAPAVDRRRSTGRQATCCRGRATTKLLGLSQGHQQGCRDPLVLVLPLATAAGDPLAGAASPAPSPARRRDVEGVCLPLCLSI